jgi:uncharacterized Zn-binding protein involved in type VI secretion
MTDSHTGPCTKGSPMPILPPCCPTVLVLNLPAARVTDMSMFVPPPPPPFPHPIVKGSMTVLIQNLPAARLGDHVQPGRYNHHGRANRDNRRLKPCP